MPMNVQAIPTLDDRINQIRLRTAEIVNEEILPHESELWQWRRDGTMAEDGREKARERRKKIEGIVKESGLWAPHLPEEYGLSLIHI